MHELGNWMRQGSTRQYFFFGLLKNERRLAQRLKFRFDKLIKKHINNKITSFNLTKERIDDENETGIQGITGVSVPRICPDYRMHNTGINTCSYSDGYPGGHPGRYGYARPCRELDWDIKRLRGSIRVSGR
jgi:hypothetical protein